jgi:hypothetical protein
MFESDQIFPLSIYAYAESTQLKNPGPLFNNTSLLYYEETSDSFSTFNDDDRNMLSSYVGILLHLYGILNDGDYFYVPNRSDEVYI